MSVHEEQPAAAPRVVAAMIVKNEEPIIPRFMESFSWLAGIAVYDTRSTDCTLEVLAREAKLFDIASTFYSGDFVDFSHARNESLELAAGLAGEIGAEWILVVDADFTFQGNPAFLAPPPNFPKPVAVWSGLKHGPLLIPQPRMMSYSPRQLERPTFRGLTHEYLDVPLRWATWHVDANKARFIHHQDGANRGDKSERDIELLTRQLATDGPDPRTLFYLAQCLREAGKLEPAIVAYQARREMDAGFEEEHWYSLFGIGLCQKAGGGEDHYQWRRTMIEAIQERPWRAEPYRLIAASYPRGTIERDYFTVVADNLPLTTDTLFVEPGAYRLVR